MWSSTYRATRRCRQTLVTNIIFRIYKLIQLYDLWWVQIFQLINYVKNDFLKKSEIIFYYIIKLCVIFFCYII